MKSSYTALLLSAFLSACAPIPHVSLGSLFHETPAPDRAEKPMTLVKGGERKVTFPIENEGSMMPDGNHPEMLVAFALRLADKGEPAKAAAFLLEAADSRVAHSRANEFRIASVAAAASLYLEAGEIGSFHDAVSRLRREMDRFQIAAVEPAFAVLLAISDKLAGRKPEISLQIPWPVRDLFREGTNK